MRRENTFPILATKRDISAANVLAGASWVQCRPLSPQLSSRSSMLPLGAMATSGHQAIGLRAASPAEFVCARRQMAPLPTVTVASNSCSLPTPASTRAVKSLQPQDHVQAASQWECSARRRVLAPEARSRRASFRSASPTLGYVKHTLHSNIIWKGALECHSSRDKVGHLRAWRYPPVAGQAHCDVACGCSAGAMASAHNVPSSPTSAKPESEVSKIIGSSNDATTPTMAFSGDDSAFHEYQDALAPRSRIDRISEEDVLLCSSRLRSLERPSGISELLGCPSKYVQDSFDCTATTDLNTSHEESEPTLSLEDWCRSVGLSDEVLRRLQEERFRCPTHLVHLSKDDLEEVVEGLRLGEKAHFFHAVHQLKEF